MVTVTSADDDLAPAAAPGGAEIVMIDCSGSMGDRARSHAARQAATVAAIDAIRDGVTSRWSPAPRGPHGLPRTAAWCRRRPAPGGGAAAEAGRAPGGGTAIGRGCAWPDRLFTAHGGSGTRSC